jgi:REP element-mobilizing transposase RayT
MPLIVPKVENRLYSSIRLTCEGLKCRPMAIGGTDNHVHVLVRFPASLAVADLVKEIKGTSSHLMNYEIMPGGNFKWQGAYGAFTVGLDGVDTVSAYVRNQKTHHAENQIITEIERCEEVVDI